MKMLSTLAEHSMKALSVLVQKIRMAGPVTPQICVENRLKADLLVMLLTSPGSLAPASLILTSFFIQESDITSHVWHFWRVPPHRAVWVPNDKSLHFPFIPQPSFPDRGAL